MISEASVNLPMLCAFNSTHLVISSVYQNIQIYINFKVHNRNVTRITHQKTFDKRQHSGYSILIHLLLEELNIGLQALLVVKRFPRH